MAARRNTVQRQLVYNAVSTLNTHASADQVFEHIARDHPSVSKATVYRNLRQMTETGELVNIGNFYGTARYDHNLHPHYHFLCEACKRVFDIEADFSDLPARVADTDGLNVDNYHLSFSGLCKDCKKS
jgi:Fur family ferric uptake transcriptional regulator/Fur family peroxide stress response transcriptional regulator